MGLMGRDWQPMEWGRAEGGHRRNPGPWAGATSEDRHPQSQEHQAGGLSASQGQAPGDSPMWRPYEEQAGGKTAT